MHSPLSADDCKPNKSLRLTVKAFLKNEEKKRDKIRAEAVPPTPAPATLQPEPLPPAPVIETSEPPSAEDIVQSVETADPVQNGQAGTIESSETSIIEVSCIYL